MDLQVNELAVAVVLTGGAIGVLGLAVRWVARNWFLVLLWRLLSGAHPSGQLMTDAGWVRHGQKALTTSGHAPRYWHRPRLHRAGMQLSGLAIIVLLAWGELAFAQVTNLVIGLFGLAMLALLTVSLVRRARRRTWHMPLHLAAHELAGHPRALRASSWITLGLDAQKAVTWARLELPQGWPLEARDKDRLVAIASAKLGIEAPESTWRLAGPKPQVTLVHSDPPPRYVDWGDVAAAVDKAHANEFVVGVGKSGRVVTASLSLDSPHFAVNMGTGGGKSNLVAFWLVQHLMRGGIALVLDQKQISQPWLYKDADGRYDFLPNIGYCWTTESIHAALVWLGEELTRREDVSRGAITASGDLRGNVGPRLMIVAEELNYATPELRALWNDIRAPSDGKRSPALQALGKVAFAGRQVKMNLVLVGQMLTADVTGQKDSSVRENVGVMAMARYGMPGWKAAVGANVPMPPSPSVLGRVQLVTKGPSVSETQTPHGDLLLYRELAVSGTVTLPRSDMPGVVSGTRRAIEPGASDVPVSHGTVPGPSGLMTLSEAVERGVVRRSLQAIRKASQRPGFPDRRGMRGMAGEWDAAELAEWDAARR